MEVLDIKTIGGGKDELLDEELMAFFPRKRESKLDEMLLVKDGEELSLIRKEDILRAKKQLEDVLLGIAAACGIAVSGAAAAMAMCGIGSRGAWSCLIGAIYLAMGAAGASRRYGGTK